MTDVIFRKYRDNKEIFAIFPYEIWNYDGDVACYEHFGQHGAGDYFACIEMSTPANPKEYSNLLRELKRIGYDNLRIMRKRNHSKWLHAVNEINSKRGAK